MERSFVSIAALLVLAGSAAAQSPYGSVEFRWREASLGVLPTVAGRQTAVLNPLAGPTAANATPDLTDGTQNALDSSFTLVLEARVTRTAGNTDLRGLNGLAFNLSSNDSRSTSAFAGTPTPGPTFDPGTSGNGAVSDTSTYDILNGFGAGYRSLPPDATAAQISNAGARNAYNTANNYLPGSPNQFGDLGVFGPFRRVADLDAPNQKAIGVINEGSGTNSSVGSVLIAALTTPLGATVGTGGTPGPYNANNTLNGPAGNTFSYYGLDTWVPLYVTVFNLTDVTAPRGLNGEIVISVEVGNAGAGSSGISGIRGQNNTEGVDSWALDNAGLPSFVIAGLPAVPAPGAATLLGLGGLIAARRRRA